MEIPTLSGLRELLRRNWMNEEAAGRRHREVIEAIARDLPKLLLSLILLILAGAHTVWPKILDQTGLILVLLAILLWIIPFLQANFTSISVLGLKLDLVQIQKQLSNQSQRIDELYLSAMGEKNLEHLRKLGRQEGYGSFYVGSALPRELEYLEDLGFIRFKGDIKGLDDFLDRFGNQNGENLSDYVELTETGKLFLDLREEARRSRDGGRDLSVR